MLSTHSVGMSLARRFNAGTHSASWPPSRSDGWKHPDSCVATRRR